MQLERFPKPCAGLVVGALVQCALAGCQPGNRFVPPPPPKVTVAHPLEREIVDAVEYTGNTEATATVDLRARISGYLEKIAFDDGTAVKKGDLLFVIEQAPFQVALDQARAQQKQAVASLQLAEADFTRANELSQKNAISRADFDTKQSQLATAQAGVEVAAAAIKQADLNFSYTEIRAPLSGRIGRHLMSPGDLIYAQQTLLATIQSIDPIYAYFNISESDALRFMKMLRAKQLPDPSQQPPVLHLGLANEQGFPHEGHLDFREWGVNPATGTALRRGVFPNPDQSLVPGLFIRIRAQIGDAAPRILVPEQALSTDQRGDYLLVVNDENVVVYRPVRLGISEKGLRMIESGLKKSEWIVVNGLQRARPGAKVDPEPVQPAALASAAAEGSAADSTGSAAPSDSAPPAAQDTKASPKPTSTIPTPAPTSTPTPPPGKTNE